MKKFIFLVMLLLIVSLVSAASYTNDLDLKVTLLSQSPDPVEPGQQVKIKFKVENEGPQTKNDVILRLKPNFPFSLYGDVLEKNIGKLRGGQTGADAVIVEYKLKIDDQAIEQDTELVLEVQVGEFVRLYDDSDFLINIQTHDSVLAITSIISDPEQIGPGDSAKLSIMVKNLADSLMKDIRFSLDFSDDDLPLAPYQSSSERILPLLKSGFQNTLVFEIIADPAATSGLYKIPVTITYNDEKGNTNSIDDILAIKVGDTPTVKPYIRKSTVLQDNKAGTITLGIANSGATDVKFVELLILPSEDYQLVSTTDYYYLGDIDSDDTESEEITIFINNDVDVLRFPVKLKYTDGNNRPFQQQFDLKMNLYSSGQLKKFGVIERSNTMIVLVILVLGGGGYFYYRKYYKKNGSKNNTPKNSEIKSVVKSSGKSSEKSK